MINELKVLGNQRDVPYQSLMKIWLAEKIQEMKRMNPFCHAKSVGA
jgi:hypothetical protein